MKFGKLAVSLTAAAAMGAFAPAFAQNTSTYTTSSSSDASMRNTDDNAPSTVQQEQGTSSSGGNSSGIEQDQDQTLPQSMPSGGTYRTDSSSGPGSSGNNPATPSESGRQPAPY